MARVSKDFVINTLRNKGIKYWKITAAGSSYPIDEMQDEEISLDKSLNQLEAALAEMREGLITIQASERSKNEKGRGGNTRTGVYEFKVDCREGAATSSASPISGLETFSPRLEALMRENNDLRNQITEIKSQHQLELMRKDLEEAKAGDPYTNTAIQALAGYFLKNQQQPAAIAGTPLDEAKRKEINAAIKRLLQVDSNLGQTLTALATFAETQPDQYAQYLTLLKNQVNS